MKEFLEKLFHLKSHQTTIKKECLAGFITFSTMAYIIVVNPLILSAAGMDFSSVMIATIIIAALATLLMGVFANYPFAAAPGMGMNAYFTYSVVLAMHVPWQTALGIVFITGIFLLILWATGFRVLIIRAIPKALKVGATAGMGLFLVLIALINAKIIINQPQTLVTLGAVNTPDALFTGFGVIVICALMAWRVEGAILIGILINWLLGLGFGLVQWKGFVAWPHFPSHTFLALDIKSALVSDLWIVIFSFIFIGLFDSSGSLMGLAHQGRFLNKEGKLPRLRSCVFPDSIGTFMGSLLGTSPTVVYIESSSGIASGGRTGLTAVVVGLLFCVALFFEPLAASIPTFAINPVLIVVGSLMMRTIKEVEWDDPSDFIPSFVTIVGIPLTYSIGTGIGLGMVVYPFCKLLSGKWSQVHWLTWILAGLFIFKFS